MRPLTPTVVALTLALAISGCTTGSSHKVTSALGDVPAPTASVGMSPPPTTTPSLVPVTTPTAAPKLSPTPPPLPSYDIKAAQSTLAQLGYYGSVIDGDAGPAMQSAVMAFQKVNGLSADGTVGPQTLSALKAPIAPTLKGSGSGLRLEVDLTKQVVYVARGHQIIRIMPTSSGNGMTYGTRNGQVATALSPVGYYTIQRRIVGAEHAELGTLYDPQYFYQGWAIHGSNSVPAYPASHGCLRLTRADARWLFTTIGVGTSIYIYGGSHTFTAGSSAPGTTDPGGDPTEPASAPPATATPTSPAKPTATATPPAAKPTHSPRPTASPTPAPSPSASPAPTGSPQP